MTVKTQLSKAELAQILSRYDLGSLIRAEALQQGTVQTNYLLQTSQGKFVFRLYENRSREMVLFESELLEFLTQKRFPCPAIIKNTQGETVGTYLDRPFLTFEFVEGVSIPNPGWQHQQQLIRTAAELQQVTAEFTSSYTSFRWNYAPPLCSQLARESARELNADWAGEKSAWIERVLAKLELPDDLPKGICHCDFHYTNLLYRADRLVAVLDFDDANYTYLPFDLVVLLEAIAWPMDRSFLDIPRAREVIQEYQQHRPLGPLEKAHLFDVYTLSILFDAIWYFDRGGSQDFREKTKIDSLAAYGRQNFLADLFQS